MELQSTRFELAEAKKILIQEEAVEIATDTMYRALIFAG
jgi:hypothetical protein